MGCGPSQQENFFAAKTEDGQAGGAYRAGPGGEKAVIPSSIDTDFYSTEGAFDLANVQDILSRTQTNTATFVHNLVWHSTHKRDFGNLLAKISPNGELEMIEFDAQREEREKAEAEAEAKAQAASTPKLPQMAAAAERRRQAAAAAAAAAATAAGGGGGGGPAESGGGAAAADGTTTQVFNAAFREAYRQKKRGHPSGAVVTIDDLYEVAELVDPLFKVVMEGIASTYGGLLGGVTATFAPGGLKAKDLAQQQAHDQHNNVVSMLFDIVGMTFKCNTADEVLGVIAAIKADPHVVHTIKGKNRCRNPTANGFFDVVMHVLFRFDVGDGMPVEHVCEIQILVREVAEYAKKSNAHGVSAFFRTYFVGSDTTVRERLADIAEILGGSGGENDEAGGRKVVPFLGTIDVGSVDSKVLFEKLIVDALKASDLRRLKSAATLFSKYALESELALLMHKKVLAIQLTAYCPDQAEVGTTYHNIANVLFSQGEKGQALVMYKKVLTIRLEALGPDHEDLGATYNNMAVVLNSQGEKEKALEMYQKALAITIKALGPKHASVGSMYNNMGVVLGSQGENDKAMVTFGKALAIRLKVLGPEHAEVGNTCYSIAEAATNMRNFDKALEFFNRAVACYTQSYGADHPETIKAVEMVAMCTPTTRIRM